MAGRYVCDMQLLSPLLPQNNAEDQSQPGLGGLNPVQFGGLLQEKACKNHKYKNSVGKCIYNRMRKRGVWDSNYGVSFGVCWVSLDALSLKICLVLLLQTY